MFDFENDERILNKPPIEPIYWLSQPNAEISLGSFEGTLIQQRDSAGEPVQFTVINRFQPRKSVELIVPASSRANDARNIFQRIGAALSDLKASSPHSPDRERATSRCNRIDHQNHAILLKLLICSHPHSRNNRISKWRGPGETIVDLHLKVRPSPE